MGRESGPGDVEAPASKAFAVHIGHLGADGDSSRCCDTANAAHGCVIARVTTAGDIRTRDDLEQAHIHVLITLAEVGVEIPGPGHDRTLVGPSVT